MREKKNLLRTQNVFFFCLRDCRWRARITMDGLSRHTPVCVCAAKVETRDEVVWARCNAGEVFLEVITFLSHINSNRRLRFEGCSDLCVYVVEK